MILMAVLAASAALAQAQGGAAQTLPQAVPQAGAAAPVQAPAKAQKSDDKPVCVSDQSTGSILAHRTCHSAAEWKAMQKERDATPDSTRAMPYPRVR